MTGRVAKLVAGNAALDKMAQSHLLGLIEPEDIAAMALFLASDRIPQGDRAGLPGR